MGWGPRALLVVTAALAAASFPSAASAECRTKPGRTFPVKVSGTDAFERETPDGHFEHIYRWSAKWKRVRMEVTRCDGSVRRIVLDSQAGKVKTAVSYREPDIVREIPDCDSDFICPRAHAAATETIKGCRYRHSGTYKASLHVSAYLGDNSGVVIEAGPADDDLDREENATQRAACGDTGKQGSFGVGEYRAEGFDWRMSGYFLAATDRSTPPLIRDLAAGRGGSAAAPEKRRTERNGDGTIVETATAEASMTFGEGDPIRNRFPDGF
jgi:hypothetical protein